MSVKGCVHIHIKGGKVANVFSHLSGFPDNCVIHLDSNCSMTEEEFEKGHPGDANELRVEPRGKVYDLGDKNYEVQ